MYLYSKNMLQVSLETPNLKISHEFLSGIKDVIKKIIEFIKKCIKRISDFFTKSKKIVEIKQTELKKEVSAIKNNDKENFFKPISIYDLVESNHPAMKHLNKIIALLYVFGNEFSIKKCLEFAESCINNNAIIELYNTMVLNPDMMRLGPSLNHTVYENNRNFIRNKFYNYFKDFLHREKYIFMISISSTKVISHYVTDGGARDYRILSKGFDFVGSDTPNITISPSAEDLDLVTTPRYLNQYHKYVDASNQLLNKLNKKLDEYMKKDDVEPEFLKITQSLLSYLIPINNKNMESIQNIILQSVNFLLELRKN